MPTSNAVLAGTALSPNPFTDVGRLTEYPFMVNALEAGTIVAVTAGMALAMGMALAIGMAVAMRIAVAVGLAVAMGMPVAVLGGSLG